MGIAPFSVVDDLLLFRTYYRRMNLARHIPPTEFRVSKAGHEPFESIVAFTETLRADGYDLPMSIEQLPSARHARRGRRRSGRLAVDHFEGAQRTPRCRILDPRPGRVPARTERLPPRGNERRDPHACSRWSSTSSTARGRWRSSRARERRRENDMSVVLTESGNRHAPGPEWISGVLRRRPVGVVLVFSDLPPEHKQQLQLAGHPVRHHRSGRRSVARCALRGLGQLGRRTGRDAPPHRARPHAHRHDHRARGHDVFARPPRRIPLRDEHGRPRRWTPH